MLLPELGALVELGRSKCLADAETRPGCGALSGANDLRRAKLGANVSRSRAVSDVVRRLSSQGSATYSDGGRCLAWFGFAS